MDLGDSQTIYVGSGSDRYTFVRHAGDDESDVRVEVEMWAHGTYGVTIMLSQRDATRFAAALMIAAHAGEELSPRIGTAA